MKTTPTQLLSADQLAIELRATPSEFAKWAEQKNIRPDAIHYIQGKPVAAYWFASSVGSLRRHIGVCKAKAAWRGHMCR